jgi:hypothetical protein
MEQIRNIKTAVMIIKRKVLLRTDYRYKINDELEMTNYELEGNRRKTGRGKGRGKIWM